MFQKRPRESGLEDEEDLGGGREFPSAFRTAREQLVWDNVTLCPSGSSDSSSRQLVVAVVVIVVIT